MPKFELGKILRLVKNRHFWFQDGVLLLRLLLLRTTIRTSVRGLKPNITYYLTYPCGTVFRRFLITLGPRFALSSRPSLRFGANGRFRLQN